MATTKKTVQLSETERLTLVNLNLRRVLLDSQARIEAGLINAEQARLVADVKTRAGVDLTECKVDLTSGAVTPKE